MAKLAIKPGSTDVSLLVKINDLSDANNTGKTGLAYNTSSLTAYYARPGSAAAAITLATQTVTGSHSDGGFVEVSSANMPGIYRLDLPDAVVAAGARSAVVTLKGAADMVQTDIEIALTTEVDVAAWNGTAIPAVHTAGYPIVTVKDGAGTGEIDTASGKVSLVDGSIAAATFAADAITAAKIAADVGTEIAAAVLGATVEAEGSVTLAQALRLMLAVLAGETTVSGATYTVLTSNGNATRVTFTLNASKERTAVTLAP